jgi:hypothetical protein
MKNFKIQYIAIVSLLLLGGAGCSFSFNTKPEEKVAPTSVSLSGEALKAKIECENLKGTVETYITDINIPNEQRVFCKFQDGSSCEQINLNDGFCKPQLESKQKQYDPAKSVIVENGTILNFDHVRGNLQNNKVNVILDDTLLASFNYTSGTLAGDFSLWNGEYGGERPDSDFDYFFSWRGTRVSTQLQSPYGKGTEKIKKGVAYTCDGPFIDNSPYFYCETDGKTYLTQYEFNAATAFAVATGANYGENWKKITVRKVGDKDVFFILQLEAGEDRMSDEPKDSKSDAGLELASKAYLDSVIDSNIPMLGSQKENIEEFDAFVQSMEFRLKGYQNHISYILPSGYTSHNEIGFLTLNVQKNNPNEYGQIEVFSKVDLLEEAIVGGQEDQPQKEVGPYDPIEKKEILINGAIYDVWLYYKKGDTQTKAELDSIVKSLKLK